MSIRKCCASPGCTNLFSPAAPDLIYCGRCRGAILASEAPPAARLMRNAEALLTTKHWWARDREFWDYLIINESGSPEWASDLIQRYRKETAPRGLWR